MVLAAALVAAGHLAALQAFGPPVAPPAPARGQPGPGTVMVTATTHAAAEPAPAPDLTPRAHAGGPPQNSARHARPPAGHAAEPPPAAPAPVPAPADEHLPPERLDLRPVPVSAPDPSWLDTVADQPATGLPIRVRLRIDRRGQVVGVEALEVAELDRGLLPAIEAMFRHTGYRPGRLGGRDVASRIDVELRLSPLPPVPEMPEMPETPPG